MDFILEIGLLGSLLFVVSFADRVQKARTRSFVISAVVAVALISGKMFERSRSNRASETIAASLVELEKSSKSGDTARLNYGLDQGVRIFGGTKGNLQVRADRFLEASVSNR